MIKKDSRAINPLEKYLSKISSYHYWIFFWVFCSKITIFWHVINLIFLSPPMNYYCYDESVGDQHTFEESKNHCPCEKVLWNMTVFTKTMQTKFGLYCDKAWLIYFTHSISYFGALLGCLMFGFLSDKYGRLVIFSISILVTGLAGVLLTLMPNDISFIFIRIIEGIGTGGCIVTSYVLCIEYCSKKYREIVTALFHLSLNIAHVTMPAISYFLRDMDQFQLTLSIPVFFFVAMYWLISESPKWMMDNGYIDEMSNNLEKMTALTADEIKEELHEYLNGPERSNVQTVTFWKIFKHKRLVINITCMGFIYFVCGMGYYGVSQFIGAMAGDIHVNVAISGATLIPGTLLCVLLMVTIRRRTLLMATCFLSGIFMLSVVSTPPRIGWLRVTFACLSNCFFFMAFIIVFLYAVELFPTSVRNSVLGVLSMLARVGLIIVPLINSLSETAAGIIFGVMAIFGGLLCIPLPETSNIELPSSLQDAEAMKE